MGKSNNSLCKCRVNVFARGLSSSAAVFLFFLLHPIERAQASSFTLLVPTNGEFYAGSPGSDRWTLKTRIGEETTTSANWACPTQDDIGCVDDSIITTTGNPVTLFGLTETDASVEWLSLKTNQNSFPYRVIFDYSWSEGDGIEYYVKVNGSEQQLTQNSGTGFVVFVQPDQTLSFEVRNTTSDFLGDLTITNFSYSEVPAPLPAAGAATAFGYSRRLRRRIKCKRVAGSCPPVLPAHPSAYLNLTPAALQSVPVSFSYASHPVTTDRDHQAA